MATGQWSSVKWHALTLLGQDNDGRQYGCTCFLPQPLLSLFIGEMIRSTFSIIIRWMSPVSVPLIIIILTKVVGEDSGMI